MVTKTSKGAIPYLLFFDTLGENKMSNTKLLKMRRMNLLLKRRRIIKLLEKIKEKQPKKYVKSPYYNRKPRTKPRTSKPFIPKQPISKPRPVRRSRPPKPITRIRQKLPKPTMKYPPKPPKYILQHRFN